ncbi:MAG: hypothetical protein DCC75_04735 [Proteobacteria bacterium]|nr:MAG: hypothetical protein DCC75_04735 [Pseudomonadota bacterium]
MEKIEVDISAVIFAGFMATLGMTLLMSLTTIFGLPPSDIAVMLARLFGVESLEGDRGIWWLGMATHFMIGALIIPLAYAYFMAPGWDASPVRRGLVLGFGLWLFSQIIIAPLVGLGVFSLAGPSPYLRLAGDLLVHLVYGGVLGGLIGKNDSVLSVSEEEFEEVQDSDREQPKVGNL